MKARNYAKIWVLACFFVACSAQAQTGIVDRVGTGFEKMRDWFHDFGEKTGDLVGPPFIESPPELPPVDLTGLVTQTRPFDEQYAAARTVSVTNSYGRVRIQSWENHVVRVMATIHASAQTEETAAALAQAIVISVEQGDPQLSVTTVYPDPVGLGKIDMKVDYDLFLPRDTSVVCRNRFADTEVSGITGTVSVDSLFGALKFDRIGGPVTVRTRGQYPVSVSNLSQGGTFIMRGAQAQFTDVGGDLYIANNDGVVELRQLQASVTADVVNNNGPIHLYVPDGAKPDIEAVVLFGGDMQGGQIQSDFPLDYPQRGLQTYARMINPNSTQKLHLQSSFESIVVHREGDASAQNPFKEGFYFATNEIAPMNAPCPEGFELVVDAIPGDVTVHGTDTQEVVVSGTRIIRLERQEDAQRAYAALELRLETVDNQLRVRSESLQELEALGAISATLNLVIQCPRTVPIQIHAERGRSSVEGTGAAITLDQREGNIELHHSKGPLNLTTRKGDIAVSECEGPLVANGAYGTINVFNVFGRIDTQCFKGTTIIEAAQGEVLSRSQGGDVRIIATELIGGGYDIAAEDGNVSIILAPTANATVFATTKKGVIYNRSGQPFSGTKVRDVENFSGTLNEGLHNIKLNAINGDIVITQEQ